MKAIIFDRLWVIALVLIAIASFVILATHPAAATVG